MDYLWVQDFFEKEAQNHSKTYGYYNHNYIVEHNGEKYVIRVPIPETDNMDFRIVPEREVLAYLEKVDFPAPRLLYSDPEMRFFVHSFIKGDTLNHLYYDSTPLPDWISINLARQINTMHEFSVKPFEMYCIQLAQSPNTRDFYLTMLKQIKGLYKQFAYEFMGLYQQLLFPNDPFEMLQGDDIKLKPRKFVFCHCDVHRKNLIFNKDKQVLVILDWELLLIADPAYDIAVHFHKMRYIQKQEEMFLREYMKQFKQFSSLEELKEQIWIYRKLEQIKSASIDCVRYVKDLKNPNLSREVQMDYAVRYFNKLKKAWQIWRVNGADLQPEHVLDILLSSYGRKNIM